MRGTHAVLAAAVVASLAAAPAGSAQPSPSEATAPPVAFEDGTIEGLVEPLGTPGLAEMRIGIGCDALDTPGTMTQAHVAPGELTDGVSVTVVPGSQTWGPDPGDCPAPGEHPFTGTVDVRVSLSQDVPAYEPVSIPLELTVNKTPPEPAANETRTYGPFTANVTVTPGYFNLYNVRLDEKIQQVSPSETARFPITIDNFSNDATRFSLRTVEAPDAVEVTFEPGNLTLAVDEQGTATVVVELPDPSGLVNEIASIEVETTSASDTRPEHEGQASRQAMQVQFRGGGPAGTPAPGLVPVLAALGAALALAGRLGRREGR